VHEALARDAEALLREHRADLSAEEISRFQGYAKRARGKRLTRRIAWSAVGLTSLMAIGVVAFFAMDWQRKASNERQAYNIARQAERRLEAGNITGARELVSTALVLDPTSSYAYRLRGKIKIQSGDPASAIEDLT